jgi:hypothetical protein
VDISRTRLWFGDEKYSNYFWINKPLRQSPCEKQETLASTKKLINNKMIKIFTLLLSALFLFCSLIKAQSWSELGGQNGLATNYTINSVCSDASGNIYAGGYFTNSSGNKYVAKYNGSSWSELGGLNGLAANHWIHSVCNKASGNIYAAGEFTNSSGNSYVAKYNGSAWS